MIQIGADPVWFHPTNPYVVPVLTPTVTIPGYNLTGTPSAQVMYYIIKLVINIPNTYGL
jgi:hypothetical protein